MIFTNNLATQENLKEHFKKQVKTESWFKEKVWNNILSKNLTLTQRVNAIKEITNDNGVIKQKTTTIDDKGNKKEDVKTIDKRDEHNMVIEKVSRSKK